MSSELEIKEKRQITVSLDPITFKNLDFCSDWLIRPKSKLISDLFAVFSQKVAEYQKHEVLYTISSSGDSITIKFLGRKLFSKSGSVPQVTDKDTDESLLKREGVTE